MKAIELKPQVQAVRKIETPRCEALREGVYANDTSTTDKQCRHSSSHVIDGISYCRRHAGIKALEILCSM